MYGNDGTMFRWGFMLIVAGIIAIGAKSLWAPSLGIGVDVGAVVLGASLMMLPILRWVINR